MLQLAPERKEGRTIKNTVDTQYTEKSDFNSNWMSVRKCVYIYMVSSHSAINVLLV